MTTPSEAPESSNLERVLFRHGTLFDLDIGRWMARKKIRSSDLLLNPELDESVVHHLRLLPKAATKDLQEIESRARSYLASRSTQFPIGGGRFVATHVLAEVISHLQGLRTSYLEEVGKLIERYPILRNEQIQKLDKDEYDLAVEEHKKNPTQENWQNLAEWLTRKYEEHRAMYPTPEELRGRFHFDWRMFQIEPSSGIQGLTEDQAAEMRRAQAQLRGELQTWVRDAAAQMHQTLGAAALNASQLLARNGKLEPRNLRPLFEAFEAFRAMDFTGQSSFQEAVARARAVFQTDDQGNVDYRRTADALNAEQARNAFGELLSTMGALAQEQVAEAAGVRAIRSSGAFSRVVDI